ncbi:F-box/kelch-repeat protein At1g23390-like [Telopea speciosissima]|uniref:F-box/kelch-repeat protein At1g23390-like n=1 Tax=Telopea speciosissima TaxID=54955 RepID=UPI001CC5D99B|nr:F-box/kelch-repeat protein At1g23390-like [Telopea speciosissima]
MAKAIKRILPKHKDEEIKGDEAAQPKVEVEEAEEAPIHGDVLETMILTRLTLLDLVAASRVSKAWRGSVSTSLHISPRLKPWFIVYAFHHRNHSLTSAFAFDPSSRVWLRIQNTHFTTTTSGAIRSSDSQYLLYSLSTTGFSFSFDPFHLTWHHVEAPLVWRENPIVAHLGSRIFVAGGTYDLIDDPLAVEMYNIGSGRWETCQSMPFLLKDSATSTWISTAATDSKLYLLEKRSLLICSFDAETKTWGDTFNLNLISNPTHINPPVPVFQSTIGFVDDRLIVVGLMGDPEDLQGLGLWEVDQHTYECRPIGEMPPEMVEKLRKANSPLSTMHASMEGGSIYIYDPRNPEQIFFCECELKKKEGIHEWGCVVNPMLNYRNRMQRFVFTCSRIMMRDIQKAVATGSRTFTIETDGDENGLSARTCR